MTLHGYDVATLLKKTGKEIGEDRISVFAAQMAYNFFFSLFPLLLFMAALFGLVADRQTVMGWFNGRIAYALPRDVASLLAKTIETVVFAKGSPGILSFGLLTAAWSGSSVFGSFRDGLNSAYDVQETRPWWKTTALQLAALAVAGVVLMAATVILLNGEGVMGWLGEHLHLGPVTTLLWTVLQFPLAVASLIGMLFLQYLLLPDRACQDKRILAVGATIATVLWLAATLLFRLYVQKFHALNPTYGAIGAIMVLLTWMYYSSFVLLAVGELISEIEVGTGRAGGRRDDGRGDRIGEATMPRRHALVALTGEAGDRARVAAMAHAGGNGDGHGRGVLDRVFASILRTPIGAPVRLATQIREWVEGTVTHLRLDVRVAARELGGAVRGLGAGTAYFAVAATLGLLGGLSLLTGAILLFGDQWLPHDLYTMSALIVALVAGITATWAAFRGLDVLRGGRVVPRQAIEEARETRYDLTEALREGRRTTTA